MSKYVDVDNFCEELNTFCDALGFDWYVPKYDLVRVMEKHTIEIVHCRECIQLQKSGQCDKTHLWIGTKEDGGCDNFFCGYGDRKE